MEDFQEEDIEGEEETEEEEEDKESKRSRNKFKEGKRREMGQELGPSPCTFST